MIVLGVRVGGTRMEVNLYVQLASPRMHACILGWLDLLFTAESGNEFATRA
jgi:hypothetical protein